MSSEAMEPCTIALFGAFGDLALRKLFPALFQLDRAGLLPPQTQVLALGREMAAEEPPLTLVMEALRDFVPSDELDQAVLDRFISRLDWLYMDFQDAQAYQMLAKRIGQSDSLIAYFATPAKVYASICSGLAGVGLAERTRVVLEKPIGHDLQSSRAVNEEVARYFPEERIYRIDHYLGKETVQNLIALRFANNLLETQWNQNHISHVEITVAEKVEIGRAHV